MGENDAKRWNQKKKEFRECLMIHLQWHWEAYKRNFPKWDENHLKDIGYPSNFKEWMKGLSNPMTIASQVGDQSSNPLQINMRTCSFPKYDVDGRWGNESYFPFPIVKIVFDNTQFSLHDHPTALAKVYKNVNRRM